MAAVMINTFRNYDGLVVIRESDTGSIVHLTQWGVVSYCYGFMEWNIPGCWSVA